MAAEGVEELGGLAGWVLDVIEALGEAGVGLLVALENLFPPIPSEVVLPLAGLLAAQGRISLTWAILAATVGSVLGAVVLYEAGARLGRERIARIVQRLPLLDVEDLTDAEGWFERHGKASVLVGRCVPGARSLVSIPAGVERMERGAFLLLTTIGSGAWNTAFVLLGYLVAENVEDLETIGTIVDVALYTLLGVGALLLTRRIWRRRRASAQTR